MRTEIGSDYWLTADDYERALMCDFAVELPINLPNKVYFTNLCRTSIELLLNALNIKQGRVLLPEFTCHSVVVPFLNHGYQVFSYRINTNLTIETEAFAEKVKLISPDIVLLHSYFGFETINSRIRDLAPKALLIEDLTQRMFSAFPLIDADCYVGSIRKWMPIPDGGFYSGNVSIDLPIDEHEDFVKMELDALLAKGRYMQGEKIEKSALRALFNRARQSLKTDNRLALMSRLSRQVYNSFDISSYKASRQDNARYLINGLQKFDFLDLPFKNVDDETVPFMFPVLVKANRGEFQKHLASQDVYATIIWTCPEVLLEQLSFNGRYIYDHILCFHCDQRYSLEDMQRIIDVINDYK